MKKYRCFSTTKDRKVVSQKLHRLTRNLHRLHIIRSDDTITMAVLIGKLALLSNISYFSNCPRIRKSTITRLFYRNV